MILCGTNWPPIRTIRVLARERARSARCADKADLAGVHVTRSFWPPPTGAAARRRACERPLALLGRRISARASPRRSAVRRHLDVRVAALVGGSIIAARARIPSYALRFSLVDYALSTFLII